MKWVILILAIGGAGFGYYLYTHPANPAPAPVAPAAPVVAPVAVATPAPAIPTPTPRVPKGLAPKGVYFLTQPVSVTLDSGIVGITAGTKVTFVKDNGKKWVVTDGQTQIEVTQDQLTNDLDVADDILKGSQDQAAAAAASVRAQQEAIQKAKQDQAAGLAKEQQWEAATRAAAAATPTPTATPALVPGPGSSSTSTGGTPPPFGRPAP